MVKIKISVKVSHIKATGYRILVLRVFVKNSNNGKIVVKFQPEKNIVSNELEKLRILNPNI